MSSGEVTRPGRLDRIETKPGFRENGLAALILRTHESMNQFLKATVLATIAIVAAGQATAASVETDVKIYTNEDLDRLFPMSPSADVAADLAETRVLVFIPSEVEPPTAIETPPRIEPREPRDDERGPHVRKRSAANGRTVTFSGWGVIPPPPEPCTSAIAVFPPPDCHHRSLPIR